MDDQVQRTEERLTAEMLERFLAHLSGRGRSQVSLQEYRRSLTILCGCLPEGKAVTASTGAWWKRHLEEQGFSPRTVNARISVWNSLMRYLGHRDWQVEDFACAENDVQPELTRAEYLRLLSAAKQLEQDRAYLLIKTLGNAGLRVQELPQLTVEAVRRGVVHLESHDGTCSRILHLPAVLQGELMAYAKKEGIGEGPVFLTSGGKPMDRSGVWQCIKRISRSARVSEEKATPRCLWKMYQTTKEGIWANVVILAEQAYERLLEQEQLAIGWEDV